MNKLFICGDTHIPIDIHKLNTTNWTKQKILTKKDVLIQLGDFGGIWYPNTHSKYKTDLYWLKWLANKKFTFCFIDGNHENHDLLNTLPTKKKFGGIVGVVKTDNGEIYHLKRGEIYNINGKTIMTIGGATSIDKESRKEFINWWKNETLSYQEENYVLEQLKKYPKIDYMLTHTCPVDIVDLILKEKQKNIYFSSYNKIEYIIEKRKDSVSEFFNHILNMVKEKKISIKEWHFGHFHQDFETTLNNIYFQCHYNQKPKELKKQ